LTLLFCPILVFFAYLADIGYFDGKKRVEEESEPLGEALPDDVTPDELAQIEQQIRNKHGKDLTADQVTDIMQKTYFTTRSRAYYRKNALQNGLTGKAKAAPSAGPADLSVQKIVDATDDISAEKNAKSVCIGFESARYAFLENCGQAVLIVVRTGPVHCRASVHYKTRDGTAKKVTDYDEVEDVILIFEKDEVRKEIKINIIDDNAYEENEEFYVDLSSPVVEDSASCKAMLSDLASVEVVIIDDDEPGVIKFQAEEVEIEEQVEEFMAEIVVVREAGATGEISCKYDTENMTAIGGMDYEAVSGTLAFDANQQSAIIEVPIKPKGRYEKTASFNVRLSEPKCCQFDKETDGGEDSCICHVKIIGKTGESRMNVLTRMQSKVDTQQARLGHTNWKGQFYDAIFKVIEDDDEEDEDGGGEEAEDKVPGKMDWFMHILSMPWKLLFALVPPTDYCGGWACFIGALAMIAVVTAIVGDMANLVGCCMGIEPEITAITFVALGTSLPDTFASKAAASQDEYADASIGNVTGSNCVNVFLGLGLSWTLAALYWETHEPTEEWLRRMGPGGAYYSVRADVEAVRRGNKAVFVVPGGSLWFNLMVFSANAFCAIQHLYQRRRKFGGELGGPRNGFMGQYFSACFLCFQWAIYIGASSVWATIEAGKKPCA